MLNVTQFGKIQTKFIENGKTFLCSQTLYWVPCVRFPNVVRFFIYLFMWCREKSAMIKCMYLSPFDLYFWIFNDWKAIKLCHILDFFSFPANTEAWIKSFTPIVDWNSWGFRHSNFGTLMTFHEYCKINGLLNNTYVTQRWYDLDETNHPEDLAFITLVCLNNLWICFGMTFNFSANVKITHIERGASIK